MKHNIISNYYLGPKLVRTNRAVYNNSAVLHAVNHMQLNDYGANKVEVFDSVLGVLHAIVTRTVGGDIVRIVFQREVQRGM